MKVSPEYFIQLSHRVNTLHREKENLLKVQVKILYPDSESIQNV